MRRDEMNGDGPIKTLQDSRTQNANGRIPPTPYSYLLTPPFSDRDPPRANAMVRYLLDAWHSTTSADRPRELLLMRRIHT